MNQSTNIDVVVPALDALNLFPDRELNWLARFNEVCSDPDAGGHDLPKDIAINLCDIGALRHAGGGVYQMTQFGHFVMECLEGRAGETPKSTPLVQPTSIVETINTLADAQMNIAETQDILSRVFSGSSHGQMSSSEVSNQISIAISELARGVEGVNMCCSALELKAAEPAPGDYSSIVSDEEIAAEFKPYQYGKNTDLRVVLKQGLLSVFHRNHVGDTTKQIMANLGLIVSAEEPNVTAKGMQLINKAFLFS